MREGRQQAEQRDRRDDGCAVEPALRRGQQRDRRQARVDQVHGDDHAQLQRRGDPAAEPLAGDRPEQVDRALRRQGERDDGPGHGVRGGLAGREEHERRAERIRGVGHGGQRALGVRLTAEHVRQHGDDERGGDQQRHRRDGQPEQHRDEHELGRHRVPRTDVEPDARGHGVRGHERDGSAQRQRTIRGREHGQRPGGDEAQPRGRPLDPAFAGREAAGAVRASAVEEALHRPVDAAPGARAPSPELMRSDRSVPAALVR